MRFRAWISDLNQKLSPSL